MHKLVALPAMRHPMADMLYTQAQQRATAPNDRYMRMSHWRARVAAHRAHGHKFPLPIDKA